MKFYKKCLSILLATAVLNNIIESVVLALFIKLIVVAKAAESRRHGLEDRYHLFGCGMSGYYFNANHSHTRATV